MFDKDSRVQVLQELASSATKLSQPETAIPFLEHLWQIAYEMSDEDIRAKVFSALAVSSAQLGQSEWVGTFLTHLETLAYALEPKSQALAIELRGLSQAYADLGEYRKAYKLAEQIEDKYPEKVFALIHLQKRYKEREK